MSNQRMVHIIRSIVNGKRSNRAPLDGIFAFETVEMSAKAAYRAQKQAVMCIECGEQVFLFKQDDEIHVLEEYRRILKQHSHPTDPSGAA
jgi:hypothetical protein